MSAAGKPVVFSSGCDLFLKRVIPEGAPDSQVEAMRHAFMAGGKTMLMAVETVAAFPVDFAFHAMSALEAEVDDYFKAQAKGPA